MAGSNRIVAEKQGTDHVIRDPESGLLLRLKGYGSLKGQIAFRDDIDMTKPIFEQVKKVESRRKKPASKKSAAA